MGDSDTITLQLESMSLSGLSYVYQITRLILQDNGVLRYGAHLLGLIMDSLAVHDPPHEELVKGIGRGRT